MCREKNKTIKTLSNEGSNKVAQSITLNQQKSQNRKSPWCGRKLVEEIGDEVVVEVVITTGIALVLGSDFILERCSNLITSPNIPGDMGSRRATKKSLVSTGF